MTSTSETMQASMLEPIKQSLRDVSRFAGELIIKILSKTKGNEIRVCVSLLVFGAPIYYYRRFTYWSRRNVKNPRPLPFVGNYLSLVVSDYQKLSLDWLRKYGKVYGIYSGSTPQLVIADARVVKQICIKDFDKFPNHQFFRVPNKYQRSFLIVQKDDYWRSMRAIISPTFTSGKMKIMYRILSQCADDMIQMIKEKIDREQQQDSSTVINSRQAAGTLSMSSAVGSFYGIKLNDNGPEDPNSKQNFARRSHDAFAPSMLRFLPLALLPSWFVNLFQIPEFSSKKLDFFFEKAKSIVSRRLKAASERQDDYLQLLLEARADSHLTDFDVERHSNHYTLDSEQSDMLERQRLERSRSRKLKLSEWEVACQVVMLMLVATETTASLISHTIFLLAYHKDIQQRLYEELASIRREEKTKGEINFDYDQVVSHQFLDCVISEVLRLMGPALRVDRVASEDYMIEDYGIVVPKGMVVFIDFYALHHNSEYWSNPMKFDPDRFSPESKANIVPGSFAPFGIGPRACIGFRFALTEAKVAIAKLVSRFEFEPNQETVYPPELEKPFFVGAIYKDLRVAVRARS